MKTNKARAGDCTSSADSSMSWRRLGRFIAATVLAGFVLNEIWEMAQMSAYVETSGRPWTSTLELCTRAAVGDVGIILGICAAGAPCRTITDARCSPTHRDIHSGIVRSHA